MVSKTVHGTEGTGDRAGLVETLRVELATSGATLQRLTSEYEVLLADRDAIQEDRDSARQLVEDARAVVARSEAALARAEKGGYGRCVGCGNEIPAERLDALPDTQTCVSCS